MYFKGHAASNGLRDSVTRTVYYVLTKKQQFLHKKQFDDVRNTHPPSVCADAELLASSFSPFSDTVWEGGGEAAQKKN